MMYLTIIIAIAVLTAMIVVQFIVISKDTKLINFSRQKYFDSDDLEYTKAYINNDLECIKEPIEIDVRAKTIKYRDTFGPTLEFTEKLILIKGDKIILIWGYEFS